MKRSIWSLLLIFAYLFGVYSKSSFLATFRSLRLGEGMHELHKRLGVMGEVRAIILEAAEDGICVHAASC